LPIFGNHSVIFVTLGDLYWQPSDHLFTKGIFPAILLVAVSFAISLCNGKQSLYSSKQLTYFLQEN